MKKIQLTLEFSQIDLGGTFETEINIVPWLNGRSKQSGIDGQF